MDKSESVFRQMVKAMMPENDTVDSFFDDDLQHITYNNYLSLVKMPKSRAVKVLKNLVLDLTSKELLQEMRGKYPDLSDENILSSMERLGLTKATEENPIRIKALELFEL